jgi:hypothetical protein
VRLEKIGGLIMPKEHSGPGVAEGQLAAGAADGSSPLLTRRQALGRMSAVATAGAAAWVAPEILTAKPAGGASLSGLPNGGGPGGGGGSSTGPSTAPSTTGGTQTAPQATTTGTGNVSGVHMLPATPQLANTGVDVARDAEIGVAMVAGGWALQRWASRPPKPAPGCAVDGGDAGSPRDPS